MNPAACSSCSHQLHRRRIGLVVPSLRRNLCGRSCECYGFLSEPSYVLRLSSTRYGVLLPLVRKRISLFFYALLSGAIAKHITFRYGIGPLPISILLNGSLARRPYMPRFWLEGCHGKQPEAANVSSPTVFNSRRRRAAVHRLVAA